MMAFMNNLIRRILRPASFPRFFTPLQKIASQDYQPPQTVKVTKVDNPPQPKNP